MCWLVEEFDWSSSLSVSRYGEYARNSMSPPLDLGIWKVPSNHREQFHVFFVQSSLVIQTRYVRALEVFGCFEIFMTFLFFRLPIVPARLIIIKNGVCQVLRVRGRVRMARLWSLLQILLLLGPVLDKPPSTLILKLEREEVVVVVSEEELEPGPRETRCVTKDGEVSTRAG